MINNIIFIIHSKVMRGYPNNIDDMPRTKRLASFLILLIFLNSTMTLKYIGFVL